jgi:hypothetical protein
MTQNLVDQAFRLACLLQDRAVSVAFDESFTADQYSRISRIEKRAIHRFFRRSRKIEQDQPDDSGRSPAGASGPAVGQGNNIDDIPDDAYIVEHIDPDPDACPDCLGTGLDFTHTADFCHCLSCKITHQPGNRAPSVAGSLKPIIV